ncbi:hypothetical protein CPB86DRAFT_139467 [Serendipita vermifera]|nr:hypothetical protein CPB86DRAFT_139467 [Serendipita vermifera]
MTYESEESKPLTTAPVRISVANGLTMILIILNTLRTYKIQYLAAGSAVGTPWDGWWRSIWAFGCIWTTITTGPDFAASQETGAELIHREHASGSIGVFNTITADEMAVVSSM